MAALLLNGLTRLIGGMSVSKLVIPDHFDSFFVDGQMTRDVAYFLGVDVTGRGARTNPSPKPETCQHFIECLVTDRAILLSVASSVQYSSMRQATNG